MFRLSGINLKGIKYLTPDRVKETKFISAHSLQINGSVKPSDKIDFYHEGHEEHEGGFAAKASYHSFIFLRVLRDLRGS